MLKLIVAVVFALMLYALAAVFLPALLTHRRAKHHVQNKHRRNK